MARDWHSSRRSRELGSREQALAATIQTLSERVDRLSREQASSDLLVQMSRTQVATTESRNERAAIDDEGDEQAGEPVTTEHGPEDMTEMQRRSTERVLRRRDLLSEQLRTEARDPEWALATENRVAETVARMNQRGLPSARLVKSECRSTLCQIDVEVPVKNEHHRFPVAFSRIGLRSFALEQVDHDGSSTRWSVFVSRDGHELARAPEPKAVEP